MRESRLSGCTTSPVLLVIIKLRVATIRLLFRLYKNYVDIRSFKVTIIESLEAFLSILNFDELYECKPSRFACDRVRWDVDLADRPKL
jgi:hypothetical protein